MTIRLFIEQQLSNNAIIEVLEDQAHYLHTVMRMQPGGIVNLFNTSDGEWRASIQTLGKKSILFNVLELVKNPETMKDLYLGFAPIKSFDANFIVQKATELGVTKIFPIITERTIIKKVNLLRMKKAAIEAAEQCGRMLIPDIYKEQSLKEFLMSHNNKSQIIFCDTNLQITNSIINIKNQLSGCDRMILIGPEGGFSDQEREMIINNRDTVCVNLGKRVLRAETAVISALSAYQVLYGDCQ